MAATSTGGHLGGSKDILSDRKYCRMHTVIVNVRDNSSVKPEDIIHFIHENCGVDSLFACVPKSGNLYEITVDGKAPIQYLLEGIKIGQQTFECHEVVPSSIVVIKGDISLKIWANCANSDTGMKISDKHYDSVSLTYGLLAIIFFHF